MGKVWREKQLDKNIVDSSLMEDIIKAVIYFRKLKSKERKIVLKFLDITVKKETASIHYLPY
jgi:hypothetical protein